MSLNPKDVMDKQFVTTPLVDTIDVSGKGDIQDLEPCVSVLIHVNRLSC